jgi:RNA polymerase sigma-70 factor (ECF subfamily)
MPAYGDPDWDRVVLSRLCAGDELALVEIHRVLHGFVRTTVERLTRAPALTDDIVQEVFLALWTQPHRVDTGRGSIRTFVGVMARRRAIDWIRSEERRRHRQDRAVHDGLADDVDLLAHLLQAEERGRLHDAIAKLPADQRRAVELAYFESHTFRDVAVVLGIPEGTAKSRLRLALTRLRADLTAADPSGDSPSTKERS